MGGYRIGYVDNISPMVSLGDTPPKGQAGKDSRGVGLNANYSSQAPGTMRPFITANKEYDLKDKALYMKLIRKALSVMPGSEKQKQIKKEIERVQKRLGIKEDTNRIPRKPGQKAGSDKHSDLYTDENPKGTIHGLKFATVDDAKASVSKIKNSGKKHAHQIQAAIAMEQRARVMGKTGPAAVYRAFINKMKKKTKAMQKESIEEKSKGLWHNIHMRRKSGKRMRKKGEKGAPTPDALRSAQAASEDMTTTASIPNPATTAMGPRLKTTTMHDKRRKKDQFPVLLKRFRKYIEDKYA